MGCIYSEKIVTYWYLLLKILKKIAYIFSKENQQKDLETTDDI
jgi:hypothetical protein